MPFGVTITGYKYGGTYTYYTRHEAEERGIRYHTPPFALGDVPKTGWVLTSNNYVVPIIAAVYDKHKKLNYITPFGQHRAADMPYMDGRTTVRGVTMNAHSGRIEQLRNMAYWMARDGDPHVAWRMTHGYAAPPDIEERINDQQFQIILRSEYEKVAESQGIPTDFIIAQRQRQTELMTDILEHIAQRIKANEELEPTHIELFRACFNDQQANVTDMEVGYIRTPVPDDTNAGLLERSYTERMQLPGRRGADFHLTPTVKQDGAVAHLAEGEELSHPDGFHDIDYDTIDDILIDDTQEAQHE